MSAPIARGKFSSAWLFAQQAQAAAQSTTDIGTGEAVALLQFGALLALQGHDAAVATRVENDEIVSGNSLLVASQVYVRCLTERLPQARLALARLAIDEFASLPRDVTYGIALANLARDRFRERERIGGLDAGNDVQGG